MGVSYDGICFFGVVYGGEDEGWGDEAEEVMGEQEMGFDSWMGQILGVDYDACGGWFEFQRALGAAMVERFGFELEEVGLGWHEFEAKAVAIKVSVCREWRQGLIPVDQVRDAELTERYRVALEKLRELLPGGSEPAWRFGCVVG